MSVVCHFVVNLWFSSDQISSHATLNRSPSYAFSLDLRCSLFPFILLCLFSSSFFPFFLSTFLLPLILPFLVLPLRSPISSVSFYFPVSLLKLFAAIPMSPLSRIANPLVSFFCPSHKAESQQGFMTDRTSSSWTISSAELISLIYYLSVVIPSLEMLDHFTEFQLPLHVVAEHLHHHLVVR